MKNCIPNCITCLNLFSGILGVLAAYQENYEWTLLCVLCSAIFDFLDGFTARALKAYSEIGKQLDSLADLVSFGFVPGMIAFTLLRPATTYFLFTPFIGFFLTIFSALRLANFNIDERQKESFIGLATPANALFWVGLAYSFQQICGFHGIDCIDMLREFFYLVVVLVAVFSYLLVSPIPMFSLKMRTLKWSDNQLRYIFLIGCVVLLAIFKLNAISMIIIWYIILSLSQMLIWEIKTRAL